MLVLTEIVGRRRQDVAVSAKRTQRTEMDSNMMVVVVVWAMVRQP